MVDQIAFEAAIYMNLNSEPKSPQAFALIEALKTIYLKDAGVARWNKPFTRAMGALLADLMKAARTESSGYSYRSMAAGSFSTLQIGYSTFRRATDALRALGFLEMVSGVGGGNVKGRTTRFRASSKLLDLARTVGVEPSAWRSHFHALPRPEFVPNPIIVKASSTFRFGQKRTGKRIIVDLSPSPASELARQVAEINAFFATVQIDPTDCHYAFQRVFNQGDQPGFSWNKGGRLISMGDSYQQMKAKDRAQIRLGGESVVEIDIRASHLTILHALLGVPFASGGADPYAVSGIPRDVVKAWVTMTLGYDKFQTRWSKENREKYQARCGRSLQSEYPIALVREKALEQLPALKNWAACPIRWGDLQYLESCVIVDAVHSLAGEKIPSLPVHDSIIVPASKQAIAFRSLTEAFRHHVGIEPVLTTK